MATLLWTVKEEKEPEQVYDWTQCQEQLRDQRASEGTHDTAFNSNKCVVQPSWLAPLAHLHRLKEPSSWPVKEALREMER